MEMERFKRTLYALEDRWFDLRRGVDTRGVIPPEALGGAADGHLRLHSTSYQAVWTRNLRVLLREAKRFGPFDAFVDIGAGKGKACIYAAPRFRRVVGVEFAPELLAHARDNQRRAGCGNIEWVLADATRYTLPAARSLVFLFNPFGAAPMSAFLEHNLAALRERRSVLAYANDMQREVLRKKDLVCVFREPGRNLSLWQ